MGNDIGLPGDLVGTVLTFRMGRFMARRDASTFNIVAVLQNRPAKV